MHPRHPHRRRSFLKCVLVLAAPIAAAAPGLAADDALPTQSRPAVSPAGAAENRVLVLPFTAEGGESAAGYGRGLQQSLAADLAAGGVAQVATKKQPADDINAAVSEAKEAGARYVVFGQVQQVGQDVRVTGQMLDVQIGKPAAVLKTTGPASNFFAMQDTLGRQVQSAIAGNGSTRDVTISTAPAPTAPATSTISVAPPAASVTVTTASTPSYWAEYNQQYEPATVTVGNTYYPPNPPPPPMYGGMNYNPWAFGGGGIPSPIVLDGSNISIVPGPLGTVRTQTFNTLGHSIIDPPPGLSQTPYRAAASFYATPGGPTPIPAYGAPIGAYRNPWAAFAAPVGLPQRAGPPNLRPGANTPSLVRGSSSAAPAARSGGANAARGR